eukprot:Skav223742  [mRNA]  locus=scaffold3575:61821:62330:- [translate_table: standard]
MPATLKSTEDVEQRGPPRKTNETDAHDPLRASSSRRNDEGPEVPKNIVLRWVKPRLNYIAGMLVVLNAVLMLLGRFCGMGRASKVDHGAVGAPPDTPWFTQPWLPWHPWVPGSSIDLTGVYTGSMAMTWCRFCLAQGARGREAREPRCVAMGGAISTFETQTEAATGEI